MSFTHIMKISAVPEEQGKKQLSLGVSYVLGCPGPQSMEGFEISSELDGIMNHKDPSKLIGQAMIH